MSIKKIAELAGVSIGTVDRVLHGRGRVSKETKEKIERIALKTSYRPNIMASLLSKKRKVKVAIIMPQPDNDEYWQQSSAGVEEARKNWESLGVDLHPFHFSLSSIRSFETASRKALSIVPNALILVPIFFHQGVQFVNACNQKQIPVVIFNTHLPDSNPIGFIGTDSIQSGILAGELMNLITRPSGELLVLHFDEDAKNSPHMIEKEKGFRDFFQNQTQRVKRVITTVALKRNHHSEQLMRIFKMQHFSGVFVSTSKAFEVAEFLRMEKKTDVKLIGFDLISMNIDYLKQGLIHFLINQNPHKQTVLAINSVCNYLLFNRPIANATLFPLDIVTRSNLSSFYLNQIPLQPPTNVVKRYEIRHP